MIIIADGGSTKTNWCLVTEEGKKRCILIQRVITLIFQAQPILYSRLMESLPDRPGEEQNNRSKLLWRRLLSTDEMRKIVAVKMR